MKLAEAAEIKMKYKGYIERERIDGRQNAPPGEHQNKGPFHYLEMEQLSTEARQKLAKINPDTLAQASRIPGVSPSDINIMLVLMKKVKQPHVSRETKMSIFC